MTTAIYSHCAMTVTKQRLSKRAELDWEELSMNDENVIMFIPVRIPFKDWLNPLPDREGERVLWSDGTVHNFPERDEEYITVLRRVDCGEARFGAF